MKIIRIVTILVFSLIIDNVYAQQTPAPKQDKAVTIVGATAHIGNGDIIENSLIIFEDGKITQVYDATTTKMQYRGRIINAEGKHVYPGFIAPNTTLGLVEIDAVHSSDDEDEIGNMLPHVRSLIAYNAESGLVEVVRPNGILMGQITPRGGRISGTSSVVQFDAWNWEDAVIKENDAIHINWPNSFTRDWDSKNHRMKPNEDYKDEVRELYEFFASAKAYASGDQEKKHLPYAAMKKIFEAKKKTFVHVNGEKEILDVIQFKKDNDLEQLVIVGGYDSYYLTDELKENNIAVLAQRVHSTPAQIDDDYDSSYKLAKILHDNGVLVGLESSGKMERMNTRNLPFYAGTVAAYGLDKEDALKLITLNNAKILGIEDIAGSLEEGKDATLFISEGDALDMRGNVLTHAFIQGREISLETRQTELWQRYMNKYERKK